MRAWLLLCIVACFASVASASDFFIFFSSHKTQNEAQFAAAEKSGWVLITDFYPKLKSHDFAVVRGPFRTKAAAQAELAKVVKPGLAKVKDAGSIRLGTEIGGKPVSPQVIAAMLGEIRLDAQQVRGQSDCEPPTRYRSFTPHYFVVNEGFAADGLTLLRPSDATIPMGVFGQVSDSGEIVRHRYCNR